MTTIPYGVLSKNRGLIDIVPSHRMLEFFVILFLIGVVTLMSKQGLRAFMIAANFSCPSLFYHRLQYFAHSWLLPQFGAFTRCSEVSQTRSFVETSL